MDFIISVCMICVFSYMHLTCCYCLVIRDYGVLISAPFPQNRPDRPLVVILGVIPPDYPRDALKHPSTVLLEGLLVLPGKTNQSLPTGTYPRTHQPTPLFDLPVKSQKTPQF